MSIINPQVLSLSATAGTPEVSINGGAWGTGGPVSSGDTIQLRIDAAATPATTRTVTVTVGASTQTWSVTTA